MSRAAQAGVSTTALGLGNDYNENLLEAIGNAGDGSYQFIESPIQLSANFEAELQGLSATVGQTVSLGIEPGQGVAVLDVLVDLERMSNGRLKLPNLISELRIKVLARLQVPAGTGDVCSVRLAWDAGHSEVRGALVASE